MKKIVFFVFPDRAACFQLAQKKWMCEKINSEDWSPSTLGIPDLLKELSERLNSGSELATVELYLVYERSAISYLKDVPEALTALGCTCWQILRWEPLLHRATGVRGSKPEDIFDCKWLTDTMLPVLESTFNYTDQAFDAERGRVLQAHEETMESLRTEKQQLIQEKAALQAQIEALRLQDIEHLFAFLPAIYRNFWGLLAPMNCHCWPAICKRRQSNLPFRSLPPAP